MKTLDYIVKKFNLDLTQQTSEGRYVVIPGKRRTDLVKLFAELNFKVGAEIGVMRGKFSEIICQNNPQLKLFAIDSWKAYKDYNDLLREINYQNLYNETVKRLSKYNCKIIRKTSMEAVGNFKDESLDFVYIDANHTLKYIIEDIVEWTKKVRKGGIVSGHDFNEDKKALRISHVVPALNAYIASYNINCVFILGKRWTKDRDIIRSWFFVKQ